MGSVYSPSLAEATVYGYTFLLATHKRRSCRIRFLLRPVDEAVETGQLPDTFLRISAYIDYTDPYLARFIFG